MIVLNPRRVQFGTTPLENVTWIAMDRRGTRITREWGDEGPYPVFVDVPEQSIAITVVQELLLEDLGTPFGGTPAGVGQQATLTFVTGPNPTDQARRRVSVAAILVELSHSVSARRATRTLVFEAVASNALTDPVVVTNADAA
jgi:hypothetical protein